MVTSHLYHPISTDSIYVVSLYTVCSIQCEQQGTRGFDLGFANINDIALQIYEYRARVKAGETLNPNDGDECQPKAC